MIVLILLAIAIGSSCSLSPSQIRRSLKGRKVTVSIIGLPPYVFYNEDGSVKNGVDVDIVNIMSKKMGFELVYKVENTWMSFDSNGTMTGSIGSVQNGISEFAIGHYAMSLYTDIYFSATVYPLEIKLVAPKPKVQSPIFNVTKPFTTTMWIAIFGCFLISSSIFACIFKTERDSSLIILDTLSALCSQTTASWPLFSSKIYYQTAWGAWLLFVLLISSSYESNLRAYLMSVEFEKPIDSDQDMVDQNWKLFLPIGAGFEHTLRASPIKAQRTLAHQTVENNQMFYYENGLTPLDIEKLMIEEGGATVLTQTMALAQFPLIEERYGYQPMRLSKGVSIFTHSAYPIPKGVPWLENFNNVLLRTKEGGIIEKITRSYIQPRYLMPEIISSPPPKAFQIEHVLLIIFIWCVGCTVAIMVFVAENVY